MKLDNILKRSVLLYIPEDSVAESELKEDNARTGQNCQWQHPGPGAARQGRGDRGGLGGGGAVGVARRRMRLGGAGLYGTRC